MNPPGVDPRRSPPEHLSRSGGLEVPCPPTELYPYFLWIGYFFVGDAENFLQSGQGSGGLVTKPPMAMLLDKLVY